MNLYEKYDNFDKQQGLNEQLGRVLGRLLRIADGGGGGGRPTPEPNFPKGRLTGPMDSDSGFSIGRHIMDNPVWERIMGNLSRIMGMPPDWWTGGGVPWNNLWEAFLTEIEGLLDVGNAESVRMVLDFLRWAERSFLQGDYTGDIVNDLFNFLREHSPGGMGDLNVLFGPNGAFTIENVDGVLQFGQNNAVSPDAIFLSQEYYNTLWTILDFLNNLGLPFR
tara:strand:- start:11 stop:673 length:663 start_codon:yes stop_codon:yes gene_type:complete